MNRRDVIKSIAAVPVACAATPMLAESVPDYVVVPVDMLPRRTLNRLGMSYLDLNFRQDRCPTTGRSFIRVEWRKAEPFGGRTMYLAQHRPNKRDRTHMIFTPRKELALRQFTGGYVKLYGNGNTLAWPTPVQRMPAHDALA